MVEVSTFIYVGEEVKHVSRFKLNVNYLHLFYDVVMDERGSRII